MASALPARAPFHLEATVRILQRRPSNLIDTWDGRCYRRTVRLGARAALIEVVNRGTIDRPELTLQVWPRTLPRGRRREVASIVSGILGLEVDLRRAEQRAAEFVRLRATAVALRGMRPPRYPDLFETFANVIPFQQLSLDAGVAVTRCLVQRFGELQAFNGARHFVFPSAAAIAAAPVQELKACGLSLMKATALRSVAQAIASGTLTADAIESLSSPQAHQRLMQLGGIGPWSAALVLLRGFRRLDMFPQPDSGAEGSLMALLQLRSKRSLQRLIGRFGAYRGCLYFYGIGSRLLATGRIQAAP